MTNISETLADIKNFAERHGIDCMALLEMIAGAEPKNEIKIGDYPIVAQRVNLPSIRQQPTEAEALELCKRFWLKQSIGFSATCRQLYDHVGCEMPHNARELSFWMTTRPAKAVKVGERSGSHVYCRGNGREE